MMMPREDKQSLEPEETAAKHRRRKEYEPRFSGFHDLMQFRVREILVVSSPYDAFVLEEDGRLSEKIFSEYLDLNLQFVPRITRVATAEEAFSTLKERSYDLVITMTRLADMNPLVFGLKIKETYKGKPVVLLTYESLVLDMIKKIRDGRSIDKIFYWSGNSRILLAIVKYIEDLGNVEADTCQGVQVILVIEDSPWFYSLLLPMLYTELMKQTRYLIAHGVNDLHRLLRMRARPKILMAETFEQGMALYQKYQNNILGIISDFGFPRDGQLDLQAGLVFFEKIRSINPDLPVLMLSEEKQNENLTYAKDAYFLNKKSSNLLQELHSFILQNFGFGDFVFRYPDGREIGRAANLTEFEQMLKTIPDESLYYHTSRNHISLWLKARTEFALAEEIRPKKVSDFSNTQEIRHFILHCIQKLFNQIQSGVITDFGLSKMDAENAVIKLGNGSLGGKGRGIAFVNAMLNQSDIPWHFGEIKVNIPHTFIICNEVYEEFIEKNGLPDFSTSTLDEEATANRFLNARLPAPIEENLRVLLDKTHYPLAIRSSSILEDSQMLPFAGLYRTYMIPNNHPALEVRFKQLSDAIKLVYASVFYQAPREYVKNADLRIEDEKMAIVIQQVVGEAHHDIYYPVISGVAQSYNFYPISHMEPDHGIASLALGLGKTVVDGGKVYRFSPAFPQMNPPFSSPEEFLRDSQNQFYALNLKDKAVNITQDDLCSYKRFDLSRAEQDGTLFFVGSTYSPQDMAIKDTISIAGPRVVTFAHILKYHTFPLADILMKLLNLGKQAFGTHVEIEFAVNMFKGKRKPQFYFLQIRPMVVGKENIEVEIPDIPPRATLCLTEHAMGNGIFSDIADLVYVDPKRFDPSRNRQIALEIAHIDSLLARENRKYILIGFGRFGTSDPWLGIPLEWHQMSHARVVVESNLEKFHVEPSQGSHFFHNLISLKMGFFHIRKQGEKEFIRWDFLTNQPILNKTDHVYHVRFERPLVIKIDGRTARGLITLN